MTNREPERADPHSSPRHPNPGESTFDSKRCFKAVREAIGHPQSQD